MIKKLLYLIFIYIFFTSYSLSKTTTGAQKTLIKSQIIYEGISCDQLAGYLGGVKKINLLWLEGKENQKRGYVLVSSDNRDEYKIFYVCKKYRSNYDNSDKSIKALQDQDLEKIFEDPVELFAYIFSNTSQNSQKYIMKTLASSVRAEKDYNIDREGLDLALQKSVREKVTYITKKKEPDNSELQKMIVKIERLTPGDYYVFAHSTSGENFWGSTKAKSKTVQTGKGISSLGYNCNLKSKQLTKSAPYKGSFVLKCPNETINGSWIQETGIDPGIGQAFTVKGDVITAYFSRSQSSVIEFVKTYYDSNKYQLAKKNQKTKNEYITKKKEKKIVKKEQKEVKQVVSEIDETPPTLIVKENITVNDTSYTITGKIKDEGSDILYVKIDNDILPAKGGKFSIKRFSPVDETISITGIDQWGNESKPKIINVKIDIKETLVVEKLDKLNPSKLKSVPKKYKTAVIFGIEKYEKSPQATYANLDAKYFYEYARKGFGVSKENIKLLIDNDAKLTNTFVTLEKWLPPKIKKNQTDLLLFFAGHGLASNNGEELYILPQDSDPDLLRRTALSRTELFEEIIKLSPKSVTMFMDTCYSGISRDEKMLLASARPIRIVADEQEGIPDNFTIFSASQLDQISSGLKEAKHGIFSYYLMKGLEGKADSNNDKKITNGELLAYMDENVSLKASELGRQQNPSLAGDPNKVLMSYR